MAWRHTTTKPLLESFLLIRVNHTANHGEWGASGFHQASGEAQKAFTVSIKRLNTKSLPRDRSGLAFDRGDVPMGTTGLPAPVLMRISE